MGKRLTTYQIQDKVSKEHLVPRQVKIERLISTLKPTDKPSKKYPKGTYKFIHTMRQVKQISDTYRKIERAMYKKIKQVAN